MRVRVLALALGGLAALVLQASAAFAASNTTFQSPVYSGDFPDPSILLVGGTYWAYATGSAGRNLQVMSSPNLRTWSAPTDPMPILPKWASAGQTWAPEVWYVGGRYVMYYTVHDASLNMQCISVATSATPAGPFTDGSAGPLICQTADGGSIDPNPFLDPASGKLVLIWKSDDNSIGQRTHIWAQSLAANGLSLAAGSGPSLLLTESAAWQAPAIEGPTMYRNGSTYYLFYGANNYDTASSGIGYATAPTIFHAFTDHSLNGPWLGTTANAQGPQGPMIFKDAFGTTRMAFAAWYGIVGYENGGGRSLWIGTLSFSRFGTPTLN
jgi:beta-xylosidase